MEHPQGLAILPVGDHDANESILLFHPSLADTPSPSSRVGHGGGDRAQRSVTFSDRGAVALSGRIDLPGGQDTFRLSLKKGDKRLLRVESRALGRPLDPMLRVLDPAASSSRSRTTADGMPAISSGVHRPGRRRLSPPDPRPERPRG